MSYINLAQGLGAAPAPRPLNPRYRRVAAPRAVRARNGSMMFLVPKRGVGYVVNSAVNGMAEPTPVEDTASFVADRTALIEETNWGWTTPDAYRAAMIDLISNRCSVYTDACDGIGSSMSQWTAYVDGTLMPAYVSWYNAALAAFEAKNNGMNPDQFAAYSKNAVNTYNQTLSSTGSQDLAQQASENEPIVTGTPQVITNVSPQPAQVQAPAQYTPTAQTPATTSGTSATPSTGGGASTAPPVSMAAASDFFNNTFNIAGYSVPYWALGAGVVGLLVLPTFFGGRR